MKGIKSKLPKMHSGKLSEAVEAVEAFDIYQNVQMGDDLGTALVKAET